MEVDMTNEEIWDDSALLDSWNDALAEFKKYHSVYADRGAKLEDDVPGDKKTQRDAKTETVKQAAPALKLDRETSLSTDAAKTRQGGGGAEPASDSVGSAGQLGAGLGGATPPISVLGSMRDDSLKTLLMSWYYAGYYTGLYEGQHQQPQQQHVRGQGKGQGQGEQPQGGAEEDASSS